MSETAENLLKLSDGTVMENLPSTTIPLPVSPALKGFDLVPTTFAEAKEFAEFIAQSELVPKDYRGKAADIFVAVQMGMDVGLRPLQAIQNIAVINGRPTMWGDAVLAVVRASPAFDWIDEQLDRDSKVAFCTVKRRGQEPITREFSMDDAKRAQLAGKAGPWQQYPKRMLQMRARSWALRDAFPDVLKGFHVREEVEDHATVQGEVVRGGAAADINARLQGRAAVAEREGGTPEAKSTPTSAQSEDGPTVEELLVMMDSADSPDAETRIQEGIGRFPVGSLERHRLLDAFAEMQRRLGL